VCLTFENNGTYQIQSDFLFRPPEFEKKLLHHIFNNQKALLEKLEKKTSLTKAQSKEVENLASTLMLCFLSGFEEAKEMIFDSQYALKRVNEKAYQNYKDTLRILRKIKYH
jgi:hypothetical protein